MRSNRWTPAYFSGHILIDPGTALELITSHEDPLQSVWVFRYYDFDERSLKVYPSRSSASSTSCGISRSSSRGNRSRP